MCPDPSTSAVGPELALKAVGLSKRYTRGHRFSRSAQHVDALRGVDIEVRKGATFGITGESGSGKSTLALCLASIEAPDCGEIWLDGRSLQNSDAETRALRRHVQMIFQEPATALNPRFSAEQIVSEPLLISGMAKESRTRRTAELMELVGLPSHLRRARPFEFSSGQRRRLAIARALAVEPKVVILDESLTGLDLSIQGQICNLLLDLQNAYGLTYICISHDRRLLGRFCDQVAVMRDGTIANVVAGGPILETSLSRGAALQIPCEQAPDV
jgi:ABC-type dipeptide/oligopeptide/nickel transport system ATPase subunit